MTRNTFTQGDIVRLKSGGPLMTVRENRVDDLGYLICSWFIDNQLQQGNFPPESLTHDQDREELRVISSGPGGIFLG